MFPSVNPSCFYSFYPNNFGFIQKFKPLVRWGFGMLSTIDAGGNRHLHAYTSRPGVKRERSLLILMDKTEKALTLPTDGN